MLLDDSTTTSDDLTAFDLESSTIKTEDETISSLDGLQNKAEVFSKLLEDLEDYSQLDDIIKEGICQWVPRGMKVVCNVARSLNCYRTGCNTCVLDQLCMECNVLFDNIDVKRA